MQGRVAFVLIVAAFCAGALADRVYNASAATNDGNANLASLPPDASAQVDNGVNMQNCMIGALRRGMTREQANHACNEIVN